MSVQHVAVHGQHEAVLAAWAGAGDRTLLLSPMAWRNNSPKLIFPALCPAGFRNEHRCTGKGVGKGKNPLHSLLVTSEIPLVPGCLHENMKIYNWWSLFKLATVVGLGLLFCLFGWLVLVLLGFYFWNIKKLMGFESSLVGLDHHSILTWRFRQWDRNKIWVYGHGCALGRWNWGPTRQNASAETSF